MACRAPRGNEAPDADSDLRAFEEVHLHVLIARREDTPIGRTGAAFGGGKCPTQCVEAVEVEDRHEIWLRVTGWSCDRPLAHLVALQAGQLVCEREMDVDVMLVECGRIFWRLIDHHHATG